MHIGCRGKSRVTGSFRYTQEGADFTQIGILWLQLCEFVLALHASVAAKIFLAEVSQ